jgi:sugar lactone lactonase YvrE
VLNPDGSFDHRIKLPGKSPTNVAFGRPGDRHLYIVEGEKGTLERRDVGVEGLAVLS